ncbi:MAG: hypothetical protein ABL886_13575 [Rhodoglobus sp.]
MTRQNPPRKVPQGNLYDDMARHMADIPEHDLVDLITLVDRTTGGVRATLKRDGSTWKVVR